jgi:hypothetical protein
MNYVDLITPAIRRALGGFVRDMLYHPMGAAAPSTIRAYLRGLRSQDTFASAQQQDVVAVVDATLFRSVTGNQTPRRYDRLITDGQSYSVEEWRASPTSPPPVEFKILVRGGQQ